MFRPFRVSNRQRFVGSGQTAIPIKSGHDFRETGNSYAAPQFSCIMDDGLDAKHALAFAVDLGGQLSEVQLEDRQIPERFLDHGFSPSFGVLFLRGTIPIAKDRLKMIWALKGGTRRLRLFLPSGLGHPAGSGPDQQLDW